MKKPLNRRRTDGFVRIAASAIMLWWAVWLTLLGGWVTDVIHNLKAGDWLWILVDVLGAPVGAIRGIGFWFGWW